MHNFCKYKIRVVLEVVTHFKCGEKRPGLLKINSWDSHDIFLAIFHYISSAKKVLLFYIGSVFLIAAGVKRDIYLLAFYY